MLPIFITDKYHRRSKSKVPVTRQSTYIQFLLESDSSPNKQQTREIANKVDEIQLLEEDWHGQAECIELCAVHKARFFNQEILQKGH